MAALNSRETELWRVWTSAAEIVRARVADDVARATGLSGPDFGVLSRLAELGGGRLRQNELAASMGWHRSRLSHHLTRMARRGLVVRVEAGGGVDVVATDRGDELHAAARPVHAEAVRRHLLDAIPPGLHDDVRELLARLADPRALPHLYARGSGPLR